MSFALRFFMTKIRISQVRFLTFDLIVCCKVSVKPKSAAFSQFEFSTPRLRGIEPLALSRKIFTAGPNNEPAVLLFPVFREIHPLTKRTFALAIAFVQIQVAVWIIEPVCFLHLFIELSVNFPAGPF